MCQGPYVVASGLSLHTCAVQELQTYPGGCAEHIVASDTQAGVQGPKRFAGRSNPRESRPSPFDHLDVERVVQAVQQPAAEALRAWWDVAEPESKKLGGKIMNKQMVQFIANFVQWLHVAPGQPEGAILVFCTGAHPL